MKTDKEKMLAGEPYLAFCNELVTERARAKEILFEYNNLHPSEMEKRTEILKHFLGATGKQLLIEQPFRGGSVVTKDIPANVIAVGNPCKVIRELTEDELK